MKIQRGTLAFIFIMFYSFFKNFYEDNNGVLIMLISGGWVLIVREMCLLISG